MTDNFVIYPAEAVTGTMTYEVYGPSDSTNCAATGSAIESWSTDLTSAQTIPASGSFEALTTGDYFWTANFSGDAALGVPAAYACTVEDIQEPTYAVQ